MPDGGELFADLIDALPPRDGYALRPVGRRRTAVRRRTPRQPSSLALLAQLRGIIVDELTAMRQALRQVDQNLTRLADKQAELAENLTRLQSRITAIERSIAIRAPPEIRRSRR
jgi:septal ring factor EnvC (AmiA/AmiB activator)